jgi:hypothetical protein
LAHAAGRLIGYLTVFFFHCEVVITSSTHKLGALQAPTSCK